jgi:HSP20 family molecular chaperone IbpA
MKEVCIRAPEYLGCYELPYEVGSEGEEIKFEGGLLKASVPSAKGLEQKRIYRPLA